MMEERIASKADRFFHTTPSTTYLLFIISSQSHFRTFSSFPVIKIPDSGCILQDEKYAMIVFIDAAN